MRIAGLLLFVFFGFAVYGQVSDDCATGKQAFYQALSKKARAAEYPNSLMGRYDVHFYFLDLHIERLTTVIDGTVTIGARLTLPADTFCFELNQNLLIDSIEFNAQAVSFAREGNIVYALFNTPQATGTQVKLKIHYHGDAHLAGGAAIGNGFTCNSSNVWGDTTVFSLSQPYSAYEWFPCKQFLKDKADSAWVFITTDDKNLAGSNGILEGVDTLTATNQLRFRWKTHYPIDYYLISVAVGQYLDYTFYAHPASLPNDSVKIVNYMYRTNPMTFTKFKPTLDSVGMMLEYFSDLFGIYPFYKEKYGHCMTSFGGGMEHQTMTSTEYLGKFTLLCHELLHQWFGDFVTCKTWKDIYLNEGFASYGEYLTVAHFRGAEAAKNYMNEVHNIVMSDTGGSVYATDTSDVGRIFNGRLTYNKGSAVIHTLRFLLGDTLFFSGLKQYLTSFAFSTASTNDFKTSMEQSSNTDLTVYFNQWVYGEGYPLFTTEYYSNGQQLLLKIYHRSSAATTPLFITPLEVRCSGPGIDTTLKLLIDKNSNTFSIPLKGKITGIELDPNNWLLHKTENVFENIDLLFVDRPELDKETILLFPNPAHTEITIFNRQTSETRAELFDASGNIIRSFYFTKTVTLPVHDLPLGTYTFRLVNDQKVEVKKFLKN